MSALIIYALWCWSVFFLVNHSELFAIQRAYVLARLPFVANYVLQCAFCATFWATLALWWFSSLPGYFVLAAPPLVTFLNCTFLRLRGDTP